MSTKDAEYESHQGQSVKRSGTPPGSRRRAQTGDRCGTPWISLRLRRLM